MVPPVFSLRRYLFLAAAITVLLFVFFSAPHRQAIAQTSSGDITCTLTPTSGGISSLVTLPTGGPVESAPVVSGQTFTFSCKNVYDTDPALTGTVQATAGIITQPDLTANPPLLTCEKWPWLGKDESGVQKCHKNSRLSISGSLNNIGDAPTPSGTFTSAYQYSPDGSTWTTLAETALSDSAPVAPRASSRPLKPYAGTPTEPWSAGYSPALDHYWHFRVCADTPLPDGTVPESPAGGANNCSTVTRLKVLALKPDVTLWISRAHEDCGALKRTQAVILKGNKARLCWLVTPIEIFE